MFGIFQSRVFDKVIYKFSLIFTGIYCVLFYGESLNQKTFIYLLLSILTAIGISGIGYILNDLKDYKQDIITKKRNLFINRKLVESILIIALCIVFAIVPWFYLPFTTYSFYLLLLEILLFIIYAVAPFRLKERGLLGIICDALYAQVVPCLLAVYTFSKLGIIHLNLYFIIIYAFWLFFVGIRNIIKHQIEDFENDKKTKTDTFVTKHGIPFSKHITIINILTIEIILFIILLWLMDFKYHIILVIYVLYLFFLAIKKNENENTYNFINTRVLNEFYEIHLPIILLVYFSFFNSFYIVVLLLNLVLFYPIYWEFIKKFYLKYFF